MNDRTSALSGCLLASVNRIVTVYLQQNKMEPEQLSPLIGSITRALRQALIGQLPSTVETGLAEPLAASGQPMRALRPAVPVDESVNSEDLVCLEDGRRVRTLRRHRMARHGLSPEEYRQTWGLPPDSPMVARADAAALKHRVGRKEVVGQIGPERTETSSAARELAVADAAIGPTEAAPARDRDTDSRPPHSADVHLVKRREHVLADHHGPEPLPAAATGALRGRVKWFNAPQQIGEIQLSGWSRPFRISAACLQNAGVRRLYNGQEIEAVLTRGEDGQVQITSVQRLPQAPGRRSEQAFMLGGAGRHRRPVMVEGKSEALRRIGTRLAAERLFGPSR
jgi:predicted transcriptional regulator/cold shock CspA family protein